MRAHEDAKLDGLKKIVAGDERPVLSQPCLRVDRRENGVGHGVLMATDSYCAVVLPVQTDPDETSGSVPLEAFDLAKRWKLTGELRFLDGKVEFPNGATFPRTDVGSADFPKMEEFVEPPKANGKPMKPIAEWGLDVNLLVQIAAVLGPKLVLTVFSPLKPLLVRPLDNPDAGAGVVMPIRMKGE